MAAVTVTLKAPTVPFWTRWWVAYRKARLLHLAQRQRSGCLRLQSQLAALIEAHPEVAADLKSVACPIQTVARAPG